MYIHSVVQPSLLFISRMFSPSHIKTVHIFFTFKLALFLALDKYLPKPSSPQSLATAILLCASEFAYFRFHQKKKKKREKLEPIIQSEVSQKDKDQYSILTHIYGV